MKKLLLLAVGAMLAMSGSAAKWAVVGAYSNPNWNFEASTVFTGEGDNLTCTIDSLTNDFKIVDIDVNDWSVQYGTATPLEIGQPYVLQGKNGGADPANIKFAGLIQGVKNAHVSWNPSTYTLEINAAEADVVMGYPTLYVTGSFCDWNTPGEGNSVLMTETSGIYTATVDLGNSGNVEFKLAGAGWSNEIAGGATVSNDAAVKVTNGGGNLKTNLKGVQTLTFNYNTMSMTFGDPSLTGSPQAPDYEWAVVGSYSNWSFENSVIFDGEGDNLSCTIPELTNDFKIVNITIGWDEAYSTTTEVEIGKAVSLSNNVSDNIIFSGLIQSVKNAKVSWNPSTHEMVVMANESDVVVAYPTLYITGNFCGWAAPTTEGSVLMVQNNGVYTGTVDLGTTGPVEFKLVGEGWSNQIGGGVYVGTTPVSVMKSEENLKTNLLGVHTLTFNYNNMTMCFDAESGIDSIENDNEAVEYYNLQGVKVNNPQRGIYIVKTGNKTSKVTIR